MQDTDYEDAWMDGEEDDLGTISEAVMAARKKRMEDEERQRREFENAQKESE